MNENAINCLDQGKTVREHIEDVNPKSVLLCFNHGLGDFLQFRGIYRCLCETYPDIHFAYGLVSGMGYERFLLAHEIYEFIHSHERAENNCFDNYDLVFGIAFTQNREGEMSKAENCLTEEIGLSLPLDKPHQNVPQTRSRLVSVHFFSTWGPRPFGIVGREETGKKIWDEIIESELIPIETHFEHRWANPENKNLDWINANVRGVTCNAENLISLLQMSYAFIGVISGNIHAALSCLPREKVMALTTYMPSRALGTDIQSINIDNYKEGSVLEWLSQLK